MFKHIVAELTPPQTTLSFPSVVGEEGTLDKPDVLFSPSIDLVKDTLPSVYDAVPPEDITIWIDPVDGTKVVRVCMR